MANIAYRSGGTATTATGTLTLTKPTGTAENDILFVGLNRPFDDTGPTPPSGWTLLGEASPGLNLGYLTVYWKLAGASEPASYDFTFYAAHEVIGGIIAINNANTTSTILDDGGQANSGSASVTAPSITPGSQPSMLVFIGAVHQYDATFTPPSGMTEALDAAYGTDWGGITFAYLRVTSASATGTKVATASTTHDNSGWLISVNEESSPKGLILLMSGDGGFL